MSDDLVKRLREGCSCNIDTSPCMAEEECRDALEAADRIEELEAENARLREALEFYANPETYHGVMFMCDPPGGGWAEDFDENHGHDFYDRHMPGMKARAALQETD